MGMPGRKLDDVGYLTYTDEERAWLREQRRKAAAPPPEPPPEPTHEVPVLVWAAAGREGRFTFDGGATVAQDPWVVLRPPAFAFGQDGDGSVVLRNPAGRALSAAAVLDLATHGEDGFSVKSRPGEGGADRTPARRREEFTGGG